MRVGEISETVQGPLVTALWWIAVAACNLSKSYASFCVKSVDLIGSDSARTDADANLNLNRTEREWEAAKERTKPNRAKGLAAAAAKIATQIDVDDLHSWWRWWWTSEARQKCSKKTVCFAGEPKGQSDVVVVEAVVVITLDDVVVAVVVVIRLICKSKGHEGRCPLKLHRIRKAQRSRATNASRWWAPIVVCQRKWPWMDRREWCELASSQGECKCAFE